MQETRDEKFASLRAMEAFTGIHIDVRELVDSWILLTYDVPHTKEGDKARSDFLRKARDIGAVQHTESVYLLPWTPRSESLALDVAKVGNAFLWTSNVKDKVRATELTVKYDADIKESLKKIKDRIRRINKHYEEGRDGIAARMVKKTETMLWNASNIASRRGSVDLCDKVNSLIQELKLLRPKERITKHRSKVVSYDPATLIFKGGSG